jgi:hypothetical protein
MRSVGVHALAQGIDWTTQTFLGRASPETPRHTQDRGWEWSKNVAAEGSVPSRFENDVATRRRSIADLENASSNATLVGFSIYDAALVASLAAL